LSIDVGTPTRQNRFPREEREDNRELIDENWRSVNGFKRVKMITREV